MKTSFKYSMIKKFTLGFMLAACLWSLGSQAALTNITVYSNALDAAWADWSWNSTVNLANTSPVHSAGKSLSVKYNTAWAGLYLHTGNPVDAGQYDQLSFWIHGGATGNQQIRIVANGDGNNTYSVTALAGNWTQVIVPLSALGNPATLSDLYWQDSTGTVQAVFYLDDIELLARTAPPPPPGTGPSLSINVSAQRHAISDDIYGMNFPDESLATELRLPVARWGGNAASRYNWQTSMTNIAGDWYFENIEQGNVNVANLPDGSASDQFVEQNNRSASKSLMTVPLIGWTTKPSSPRNHPFNCAFKVSKYGAQQSTDPWDADCGNGLHTNGSNITGNDPTDTSTAIDPSFVSAWIHHLTSKYGTAANGGVAYYNLDNEPMLWNSTHRDIHPNPAGYDEMGNLTYQYAAAIKAADPTAKTLGPVLWGWCAYFYSALDGCGVGADYTSHGNKPFVVWYLEQMKLYEQQHAVRILDYLDLHIYPQAGGVSLSTAGSAATQALRLRSTRSLWDSTYLDESWISSTQPGGVAIRFIPRMHDWVNNAYPGTKLAITEYNWGGLENINGALTQADVLGIFGREGLDLATLWGPPTSAQPGAFAFRMYRNYDGATHGFGNVSVQASSADQGVLSVYAAQRSLDNALTIVVINKTANDLSSTLSINCLNLPPLSAVYRYSANNLNAIENLPAQAVSGSGFTAVFPRNSITLFSLVPGNLIGTSCNDTLTGNAGANVLNGLGGADTMTGGDGSDSYYVDSTGDVVTETNAVVGTGGADIVYSYLTTYTLPTNVENGRILATGAASLTGNSLNNILYANTKDNTLDGSTGIDTVSYLYGATVGVTVSLAVNTAQATIGSGSDTLLNIENLTGSNFDDNLTGNAGANVLNGLGGADRMTGGDGSDTYYVDNLIDIVTETNAAAIGGSDIVYSYLAAYTLTANVERGRILATGAANLTGNTLNNILYAGTANNILEGGTGTDTVSYQYGATAGVTVSLVPGTAQTTGGSGSDTLLNIENLIGSNYNDNLTGNNSNNILTGGSGQDTLTGGGGNDFFDFNAFGELGLGAATRDVITDFIRGQDKIDLATIDADASLSGNQAFSLVAGFTAPGQISYSGGIIAFNTDADAAAEYEIQLTGSVPAALAATDFVL